LRLRLRFWWHWYFFTVIYIIKACLYITGLVALAIINHPLFASFCTEIWDRLRQVFNENIINTVINTQESQLVDEIFIRNILYIMNLRLLVYLGYY
jgi:hypothetical protein